MHPFIEQVKEGAMQGMRESKILASLTISQAILESGWGKSGLTKMANNLFGIKAHGSDSFVTMETREWDGSKMVTINANFRKYPTLDTSIKDHARFLVDNPRYKNLIGVTDYKEATRLIQAAGYATDPNYAKLLTTIIEENELWKIDQQVLGEQKQAADPCPAYAREARDKLIKAGVTDGSRPNDPATRAEVWSMLQRALKL